ncbi:hypothetical protein OIU74_004165 [Salix koriyanagi]|uniref:Pentatricopeptide repeat-containing protein n=1 Tax=Salix koriyanagi TaxID=2511006 RepID=A0A9Q0V192_9ROSI|nr:hypothetical protein OIU74_004165 [Salix koriyanagi]
MTFKTITEPQKNQTLKTLRYLFHLQLHTYKPLLKNHNVALKPPLVSKPPNLSEAHSVFCKSPQQDPVCYNHLLFQCSRENRNKEVADLFVGIHRSGFFIDGSTLSCVLKACSFLFDRNFGIQVHNHSLKSGFLEDVSVGTALLDMYLKNENVEEGRRAFDEMGARNVVSWTSLLTGYAQNGLNVETLKLFLRMLVEGIKPNPFTFSAVIGGLTDEGMVEAGIQVHTMVIKNGFGVATYASNSLMNMYFKSGMIRDARAVFDSMTDRNAVSWNSMVAGLVTNGLHLETLDVFYHMRLAGVKLTKMVFAPVIKLCGNIKELGFSRQLHCHILKSGFEYDKNIRTTLMLAYSKCGEMDSAFNIFSVMGDEVRNVVSWTAMISGYLQNGMAEQAVNLFCQMSREGVRPNDFTYSTILTAQAGVSPFDMHAQAIKRNYVKSPSVGTALLNAYVKRGNVDEASKVFQRIEEKDIVAWSAMISGYAQIGDTEGAVRIFVQMAKEGVKPNEYTFSGVINACAAPTAGVEQGKQLHAWSIKSRFNNALCVSSALLTMYSKRGDIESAFEVFKRRDPHSNWAIGSMKSGAVLGTKVP